MAIEIKSRKLSPDEIAALLRRTKAAGGKPGAKLSYDPEPYDQVVADFEPVADPSDREDGWMVIDLESKDDIKPTRDRLRAAAHRRNIDLEFVSATRGSDSTSLVFRPVPFDKAEFERKAQERRDKDNARKAAKKAGASDSDDTSDTPRLRRNEDAA